ncbi:hypothetical protein F5887DRAFT_97981 [Amanita rubescens]|nr:hypothetical protein F5887DRAFT_97981 [Amanita rubescens]
MMRLMNQLTDKPNWHKKVFDDDIANKWKQEALATDGIDITPEMFDWCIEELRVKAGIFEKSGMVTAYDADVVKSDSAVSEELRNALIKSVKPLEDVPPNQKDWHPGSDGKVLDLVHPSLFPLVYGVSRILTDSITNLEDCIERCGEGIVCNVFRDEKSWYPDPKGKNIHSTYRDPETPITGYSNDFQWLPCNVDISGDRARITSYINNLRPQYHKDLYSIIEQIIDCSIPLWNITLTRQILLKKQGRLDKRDIDFGAWIQGKSEDRKITRMQYNTAFPAGVDKQGVYDLMDQFDDLPSTQPNAGRFELLPVLACIQAHFDNVEAASTYSTELGEGMVDLKKYFGKEGLQIIVKLANIHLTPEKPEYDGGTWHVEGQLNEHICATALYYYDNENITPSHLAFRQFVHTDDAGRMTIDYPQEYHRWLPDVFGCNTDGSPIQDVGSVETRQGRLLTFPNILQHQVQPFKLLDPAKPGHRKILALFLVDPHDKVISTANVPCQRADWWSESIGKTGLDKLPFELKDEIFKQVDFPMTMDKAEEFRLKLMGERSKFTVDYNKFFEECSFSLCEH